MKTLLSILGFSLLLSTSALAYHTDQNVIVPFVCVDKDAAIQIAEAGNADPLEGSKFAGQAVADGTCAHFDTPVTVKLGAEVKTFDKFKVWEIEQGGHKFYVIGENDDKSS
jgi:hypothetical protein